jgi:murein DD-endopeptidase MepM/ murein hydrolase activator NlpD
MRLFALALFAPLLATAQQDPLRIEGRVEQGALLRGFTERGARVHAGERAVRVSNRGEFLLAIGPDRESPMRIAVTLASGRRVTRELRVRAREFPTEHLAIDDDREGRARAEARLAPIRMRDSAAPHFRSGFERPVDAPITSGYGIRRTYRGTIGSRHWGVDFAAPVGTAIRAPADGVVVLADDLPVMGRTIAIDHGHGLTSCLLHLSRIDVRVGARVERGAAVGAAGRSGNVTGAHLDWRMNLFDTPVDPRSVRPD